MPHSLTRYKHAFTLIEISIILVIIGLLVGGVLTGRNLINTAAIRNQLAQIEQYNTAVNTFKLKYNALPGDIKDPDASAFGFAARGIRIGQGDGDGRILSEHYNLNEGIGNVHSKGETALFWMDLSQAGLIEGKFTTANATACPGSSTTETSTPSISDFIPRAKIGNRNYIYAWSGYWRNATAAPPLNTSRNYFGLSVAYNISSNTECKVRSSKGLTVDQAHTIDSKIDDGLPYSGGVLAIYVDYDPRWLDGNNAYYNSFSIGAVPASTTSCTDNGNVAGTIQNYSIAIQDGSNINCALSFKFQ